MHFSPKKLKKLKKIGEKMLMTQRSSKKERENLSGNCF